MPWPKGKPHSEETRAKMSASQTRRRPRPQTEATRTKLRAARTGRFQLHGMSSHPLYRTWQNMIARCENPSDHNYPGYGGRGIAVCADWRDPSVFIAWIEANLGPRPDGMSLDRWPDNDGDYEPGNVRWATAAQQRANQGPRRRLSAAKRWQALKDWLSELPDSDAILAKMRELEVASDASGYFGQSTVGEIAYAVAHGKPVWFAEDAAHERAQEAGLLP